MLTLARLLGGGLLAAALLLLCSRWRGGAAPGHRVTRVDHRSHVRGRLRGEPQPAPEPAGLAFALEVWAALVSAGEPAASAIRQVMACCEPALGAPLGLVCGGLVAGLTTAEAWATALASVDTPTLASVGDACCRSERDGTPLGPVLRRLAAEQRAAATGRGLAAARRAGVLAVLPLGLCTLPAYVLLSVAPAVIGLIRHAS